MEQRIEWVNLPAERLVTDTSVQDEWDRLNDLRGGVPVLSSFVVATAIEVFGSPAERLLVGRVGTDTVAMLVLQPAGAMRWQTFQPSQLPLGPWVAAPDRCPESLVQGLLFSGALGLALALGITQVEPRVAARPEETPCRTTLDYVSTAWIELSGSFDEYWAARGKNLRQNLRKQRNRLAAEGVVPAMKRHVQPDDMAPAVARYGALESRGWKSGEGKAIHPDNAQGRFYTRLLERGTARGQGAVFEYWFGDRLVASNLAICRGDAMVVLKTTYDESVGQFSPAFLLQEDVLRHLFEEGRVRRLEFYGRLMEWHTRWTGSSVRLYHLSVYRWSLLKRIALRLGERRRRQAEASAASPGTASSVTSG